jgi:hypothetical protein
MQSPVGPGVSSNLSKGGARAFKLFGALLVSAVIIVCQHKGFFHSVLSQLPAQVEKVSAWGAAAAIILAVLLAEAGPPKVSKTTIRNLFYAAVIGELLAFGGFVYLYMNYVEVVQVDGTRAQVALVVGDHRNRTCQCDLTDDNNYCVQRIGLKQELLTDCWPAKEFRSNALLLALAAFIFLAGLSVVYFLFRWVLISKYWRNP